MDYYLIQGFKEGLKKEADDSWKAPAVTGSAAFLAAAMTAAKGKKTKQGLAWAIPTAAATWLLDKMQKKKGEKNGYQGSVS